MEILQLIAIGLSNRAIAQKLNITYETSKWYNKRIYIKLDVHSRTQAVDLARKLGLLDAQSNLPLRKKSNLPAEIASFIGREHEIEEIIKLLTSSTRFLTLIGPGGIGKTRLSLKIASRMLDSYKDGVWFVDLSAITNLDLIPSTISSVFNLKDSPNTNIDETLKNYLASRELLLVLDNYEHIIKSAPLVGDLLSAAPGLSILVTSREVLKIYGERIYPINPLKLPEQASVQTAASLSKYGAIALFTQRAAAVKPDFIMTADNASSIVEICYKLDGLPLAIELAASYIRLFTPDKLCERLDDRLGTLTGGASNLPPRQKTIRRTIEWSYNLLDEQEQLLFERFAVLGGQSRLEAVEGICMGGISLKATEGIQSLLDKSLLAQREDHEGQSRFRMLETVREYALERLNLRGEAEQFQRQHAEYFVLLAEQIEPQIFGGKEQLVWLNRLEADHDNLRAALEWSFSGSSRELGQRLVAALTFFYFRNDHHLEFGKWVQISLENHEDSSLHVQGGIFWAAGFQSSLTLEIEQSIQWFDKAITLCQNTGQTRRAAYSILYKNNLLTNQSNQHLDVLKNIYEALNMLKNINYRPGEAQALNIIANIYYSKNEFIKALNAYQECLDLALEIEDEFREAIQYSNLARALIELGKYDIARTHLQKGLMLAVKTGSKWLMMVYIQATAKLAHTQGNHLQAAALLGASFAIQENIGVVNQAHMKPLINKLLISVHDAVGDSQYKENYQLGFVLSIDEAVEKSYRFLSMFISS